MNETGSLVYVVDDDPFAREGIADLIRSAGLVAQTFASGEEFLAAPRPRVPSCLVLDVKLPGLDGFDLQQELTKSDTQVPSQVACCEKAFLKPSSGIQMKLSASGVS
jgi:FixJ family two-component response regulator